jgi:hypothetical protein
LSLPASAIEWLSFDEMNSEVMNWGIRGFLAWGDLFQDSEITTMLIQQVLRLPKVAKFWQLAVNGISLSATAASGAVALRDVPKDLDAARMREGRGGVEHEAVHGGRRLSAVGVPALGGLPGGCIRGTRCQGMAEPCGNRPTQGALAVGGARRAVAPGARASAPDQPRRREPRQVQAQHDAPRAERSG